MQDKPNKLSKEQAESFAKLYAFIVVTYSLILLYGYIFEPFWFEYFK